MKTTIRIGAVGNDAVVTTIEHLFPLSEEWLTRNGAEVVR